MGDYSLTMQPQSIMEKINMPKMTREERNDAMALMYMKENNITLIEQVTKEDRAQIYSILDRK
jgi:hypothetical protein